jgi:cytoskeletal protein RodZ
MVPPCAIPGIIILDHEEPVYSSGSRARSEVLAHTTANASASAASVSAGTAPPTAPHRSKCWQRSFQAVNYESDLSDSAHRNGSSFEVLSEEATGGEITPAAVTDVPTSGPAPARGAGRSCALKDDTAPAPEARAPAG